MRRAIHQPCGNIFRSAQCIEEGNELCYVSCIEPCLKFVVREIGTWLVHEWQGLYANIALVCALPSAHPSAHLS